MKQRVLVIGAGGHCRALLGVLKNLYIDEQFEVYDLETPRLGERILDVPVLGSVEDIFCKENIDGRVRVYLAIGDNAIRQFWFTRVVEFGLNVPNLISAHALIGEGAIIGSAGVQIMPNAFVGPEASIGVNTIMNTASVIEHEATVGDHCHVSPQATLAGRVVLGQVAFSWGWQCGDRRSCCGRTNNSVGAGAVVVKDILTHGTTVVGVPARRLSRSELSL